MGNSYGKIFKITTFGESHGKGVGVIIDGCPAGLEIDLADIQKELSRRKPGQSKIVTQRQEPDEFQILSGIFEPNNDGKFYSTGTPIHIVVLNTDQKSKDYSHIADKYRPSHADYTYQVKYGIRDYRGGGRSSARETIARVASGAIAKQILNKIGVSIHSYVSQVGSLKLDKSYKELDLTKIDTNDVRCPDPEMAEKMYKLIDDTRKAADTIGGIVTCVIKGVPVGLGEPVFDKFHAELGKAMLSINAVKGFEYGSGFEGIKYNGSTHNDVFYIENNKVKTRTNYSGGVQGGITNGEDVYFNVAFKPVATIMHDQESVNEAGDSVVVSGKGRHDPCVLPRAVPIVDSMAALVTLDFYLRNKLVKLNELI
ncbi:MAG: chorismate synthase [Bacteroidota bacterium]|nr:chorismate synthase [Bacteroidota bacterium]